MQHTPNLPVYILNAFVDNEKGGNPAAVILDADTLSNEEKQQIAKEIGLSETAFVSSSKTAAYKLDFFTPNRQIAHCGHATIAAFSFLSQKGLVDQKSSKETIDGNRDIFIRDNMAFMEQLAPKFRDLPEYKDRVQSALGLSEHDLLENAPIQLVNTGNSFIIIAVKDPLILAQIKPVQEMISQISDELDLIGFYVFTTQASAQDRHASARMFAPRYGIDEESATGMAAGPLACYLYQVIGFKFPTLFIEQGHFISPPSPSLLQAELQVVCGKINGLLVGGKGMLSKTFSIAMAN